MIFALDWSLVTSSVLAVAVNVPTAERPTYSGRQDTDKHPGCQICVLFSFRDDSSDLTISY